MHDRVVSDWVQHTLHSIAFILAVHFKLLKLLFLLERYVKRNPLAGSSKIKLSLDKAAKIEKHITWHCARHSFATNLIYYKTDVTIVAKLLGHSTLKYTQRYTHIAEELKRNAVNNLPQIDV